MAQHQHILCGAGGRSSKPGGKPKKVPQRGLGVAQLEKIRVEEQRKKLQALESANETGPIPCLHLASSPSNLDGDKHLAFAFWPQSYGSSSNVPQRLYDFQPNSVLNSPIEPPSNQSSGYGHTLPDECCKISGMKRPCPFPLNDPPSSLLGHGHFHPYHRHREAMSKYMSSSSSNQHRNDAIGKLGGDFLTLAPPLAISPVEENVERKIASPNRAMSLFPARPQMEWRNGEGGKGEEAIDLNLRL